MARDLRLFYLFRLLSTSYLFVPVSYAFALSRGLDAFQFGLTLSIYSLVVIVTEVPTGAFADRLGRRYAMMAGALAMVAACITFFFAHGFAVFAVGQGLAALSMTLCSGTDSAYLFDLLHDHGRGDEYPRMESTASAWHQAGQTLAFAAGGLLGATSLALPYLITAGVATGAFVVAARMREDRPLIAPPRRTGEWVEHMRSSIRVVSSRRQLAWAIAYSAVVFLLLRSTEYVYQPYLKASGFSIAETGLVFAAVFAVAAGVAHRADALRRRFAEPTLLWGLLGSLVVTFLLLGSISGPLSLIVLAVQAGANGLYSPLVKPLINREIPDSRRRATVLSVESMVRRAAVGLFAPLVGWLMEAYRPSAGLTLCGIIGLAGLLALTLSYRGTPRPSAAPAPPRVPAAAPKTQDA
jgi:MFS family permease